MAHYLLKISIWSSKIRVDKRCNWELRLINGIKCFFLNLLANRFILTMNDTQSVVFISFFVFQSNNDGPYASYKCKSLDEEEEL